MNKLNFKPLSNREKLRKAAFRDYLIAHPDEAQAYSIIKEQLALVFHDDIVGYVDGKSSFVQNIEYKAGIARNEQLTASDAVRLEAYNPQWENYAIAEITALKEILPMNTYVDIQHLGSTSVIGLGAKPIIDICIAVCSINEAKALIEMIKTMGYQYWEDCPNKERLWFGKGIPPFGMKRTHHLHVMESNSDLLRSRVLFRDILRKDACIRDKYNALKQRIAKQYSDDREHYTNAKFDFISCVLRDSGYSGEVGR